MKFIFPYVLYVLLAAILSVSFSKLNLNDKTTAQSFTFLALGDSYTIGESVAEESRWPNLLQKSLLNEGISIQPPTIIAKTGWRTDELLKRAKADLKKQQRFDLVSLLIGVNNEFQRKTPQSFKPEFEQCLDFAIAQCKRKNKGVFVLSIPDYGYTPFGDKRKNIIRPRIDAYNQYCKEICHQKKVLFLDITSISRKGLGENQLVAKDDLHPSGEQYELWVRHIKKEVMTLLEK